MTHVKGVDPRVKRTRQLLQQAELSLMQAKGFFLRTGRQWKPTQTELDALLE